jgi:uncharacterized membrane protein YecN with MAPEG domain
MSGVGIVALYAALNALLVLGLAYNVGQNRARADALKPGTLGDDATVRAIRAHGNATEYIPLTILLMLILSLLSTPTLLLHAFGAAFTVGRVLHAYGMTRETHPNAIRFTGNLLTGLVYLFGSIACLYFAISST